MVKKSISFYTNIPSPYNLDLFEALSRYFNLKVIYYSHIENDREWVFDLQSSAYESLILNNNIFARIVQKIQPKFHFSSKIFRHVLNDNSEIIILGGNYFSLNTYAVLLISKFTNKKIFWFGEKLLPTKSALKLFFKKILFTPILNNCEAILCVGQEAISSYKSLGFKGLCYNIPYSINKSKFKIENLDKSKLVNFKNLYNPLNKQIIFSSGALIHRKGMDLLIKSYQNLPYEIKSKTKLLIAGNGELGDLLRLMDDKTGDIELLGFVSADKLPYFYNIATLFVFCSRYDGWGVVINEALSARLPVIVSDSVTSSELIVNGENGYICSSEDTDEFTIAMIKILTNDKLMFNININNDKISDSINSDEIAFKIYEIVLKCF